MPMLDDQVGSFPKSDLDIGTGLVGAPACGDVMKVCSSRLACCSPKQPRAEQGRPSADISDSTAPDQGRRQGHHLGRAIQDIWLRERHCFVVIHD